MTHDFASKAWLPLAAARDVGPCPRQFRLNGERLVAFRDEQGVVVMRDLCIHRGAALSNGYLTQGRITCPYHGWQFERDGACALIPSRPAGATIPPKARVTAYHAKERFELIWVCRAETPPAFPEWPDEAWERQDYRVFLVNEYHWKAAAERVIENALDFSHFNFAHKGFTELADGPEIKEHEVQAENGVLRLAYEDGQLRREYALYFPYVLHDRKCVIATGSGGTWSEGAHSRLNDVTIVTIIASPVDDGTSRIFAFLSRNHSLDMSDQAFGGSFDEVMEQDRRIVESQRPELIPDDVKAELHVQFADLGSIAYRRMFQGRGLSSEFLV